jgi:ABC-2 type transport system permease protein
MSEDMHEQNIYVELTTECTNTLDALKEEGFYKSDDQLITNYDFMVKYEGYTDDYASFDGDISF